MFLFLSIGEKENIASHDKKSGLPRLCLCQSLLVILCFKAICTLFKLGRTALTLYSFPFQVTIPVSSMSTSGLSINRTCVYSVVIPNS